MSRMSRMSRRMNHNENDPVTLIGCKRKRVTEIISLYKKGFSVEDGHHEYSELVGVKMKVLFQISKYNVEVPH